MKTLLVTSALPYANGPIHLGHLVEYIQTDIFVRAQKSQGHKVIYVCASDAHGTPIMLKAQENKVAPEVQVETVRKSHMRDFAAFFVEFDKFHSTHSKENESLSQEVYARLKSKGDIIQKEVLQYFDPKAQMFLSDRFIKGTCPRCDAPDQYGDNCEVCGATYDATELKDPYSTLSGVAPVERSSEHYFFDLPKYEDFLRQWTSEPGRLQDAIKNKLDEWFDSGLLAWDVSRDAPYFGFLIPGTKDKYFYVWLDAPIGYMASFLAHANEAGLDFDAYWGKDSTVELHHFIGKDIVNFHALFWVAMLKGADFRTPSAIHAHGFLTVNGAKMSKSRGTFITAQSYLEHLDPDALRYYYASKLSGSIEDINLDLDDFAQKVNADLVGKVVNIASRTQGFLHKRFDGQWLDVRAEPLLQGMMAAKDDIIGAYDALDFAKAVRLIMAQADRANEYIDAHKPWNLAKNPDQGTALHRVCSVGIHAFYQLMVYLAPIVPSLSQRAFAFLNVSLNTFEAVNAPLGTLNAFNPLLTRIERDKIDAMIEKNRNTPPAQDKTIDTISIEDFARVKMVAAKVLECHKVEGADKLLGFVLDVGEKASRHVFSGIAKFYSPDMLVGKTVICVTNLAPRKMKFGTSEGMILSSGDPKTALHVVFLDDDVPAGAPIA